MWIGDAQADEAVAGARSVVALGLRSVGCVPLGKGAVLYLADASTRQRFTEPMRARVMALSAIASSLLADPAAGLALSAEAVPGVIGQAPAMGELFETVRAFADLPLRVLLLGERGTGKTLIARAIHELSGAKGAFVVGDCTGLNDANLADDRLFGHERGAFTDAKRAEPGWVDRAQDGTLFLDEIGELPPSVQAKLLTLAEDQTYERVGGRRRMRFTGRIVCATNRPLEDESASPEFRRDLFDRLAEVVIRVPSLKERRSDLGLLARHLFEVERQRFGGGPPTWPSARMRCGPWSAWTTRGPMCAGCGPRSSSPWGAPSPPVRTR